MSCQKVNSLRKTFDVTTGNILQTLDLVLQKFTCQDKVVDLNFNITLSPFFTANRMSKKTSEKIRNF